MFSSKETSKATRGTTKGGGVFFQPKLAVNEPNDRYEQEADAMADRVMRMQQPDSVIQRKCKHCEEEEKQIHRKPANPSAPDVDEPFENYVSSLHGRGAVLSQAARNFFEPRFERDFSGVRIHTGTDAAQSAERINALAYTTGNNIVFNTGQYQPGSEIGQRLLAHELTHVAQQQSAVPTNEVQRTTARQVACAAGPFTSNGGTVVADPVAFITEAETRASELIGAAIDELVFAQGQIASGSEPGWPVIGDALGFALTLMGLNPDSRRTWVRSGVGTVNLLVRRLRAIRSTLTGTGIFYHCDPQGNVDMSPCSAGTCRGETADAFSCAGSFRILLCDSFWSQGSLEERAVMLMHEHAHNFASFIQDSGREGNAECYARFVVEANGLTASAQSAGLCPNP